jgi:hypothetical protein
MDVAAVFGGQKSSSSQCRPGSAAKISRASMQSRHDFELSPEQVCSLRAAPLISRMRDGDAGSFCRRSASWMRRLASIHSTARS